MRAQLGCWAANGEDGLGLAPLEGAITFNLKSLTEAFGRGGCASPQPNPTYAHKKRPVSENSGAFLRFVNSKKLYERGIASRLFQAYGPRCCYCKHATRSQIPQSVRSLLLRKV